MSDSATAWTGAHQAPLSLEFSRQEYWNGLPFPSPGHLPNPGIKPGSPSLQADVLRSEPPGNPYIYTILPNREIYILFLFPHLSPSTQILFKISLTCLLVSCVFILFFLCFPLSFFFIFYFLFFFEFCKYDKHIYR